MYGGNRAQQAESAAANLLVAQDVIIAVCDWEVHYGERELLMEAVKDAGGCLLCGEGRGRFACNVSLVSVGLHG